MTVPDESLEAAARPDRYDLALVIFVADNSNAEYPEQQFYMSPFSSRKYAYRIADALIADGWHK